MAIGEPDPPSGQPVHVGRFDFCGPITTQVSIAKIIRINDDYIWTLLCGQADTETEEDTKHLNFFHIIGFVF